MIFNNVYVVIGYFYVFFYVELLGLEQGQIRDDQIGNCFIYIGFYSIYEVFLFYCRDSLESDVEFEVEGDVFVFRFLSF